MPWIHVIRESVAEGELKAAYDKMADLNERMGETYGEAAPGVERPVTPPELSSLQPQAMLHAREFMMDIMRGPSGLTPAQREMIATVTSLAANCRY
jgi:alkylhydroperoxidase family enzyme